LTMVTSMLTINRLVQQIASTNQRRWLVTSELLVFIQSF
jgi:hypothetical protein